MKERGHQSAGTHAIHPQFSLNLSAVPFFLPFWLNDEVKGCTGHPRLTKTNTEESKKDD